MNKEYMAQLKSKKEFPIDFIKKNINFLKYSKIVLDKSLVEEIYQTCCRQNGYMEKFGKNKYIFHFPTNKKSNQTIISVLKVKLNENEDAEYQILKLKLKDVEYQPLPNVRKFYLLRDKKNKEEEFCM